MPTKLESTLGAQIECLVKRMGMGAKKTEDVPATGAKKGVSQNSWKLNFQRDCSTIPKLSWWKKQYVVKKRRWNRLGICKAGGTRAR